MEKLCKCPKCGARARLHKAGMVGDDDAPFLVMCDNFDFDHKIRTPYYRTKEEAVNAWNSGVLDNTGFVYSPYMGKVPTEELIAKGK